MSVRRNPLESPPRPAPATLILRPKVLRALQIIREATEDEGARTAERELGIRAKAFAQEMWPDSPGWHRVQNVGSNGAAYGVGITRAGGSYLARLAAMGLVVRRWSQPDDAFWDYGYRLTTHGREQLRLAELEQRLLAGEL